MALERTAEITWCVLPGSLKSFLIISGFHCPCSELPGIMYSDVIYIYLLQGVWQQVGLISPSQSLSNLNLAVWVVWDFGHFGVGKEGSRM